MAAAILDGADVESVHCHGKFHRAALFGGISQTRQSAREGRGLPCLLTYVLGWAPVTKKKGVCAQNLLKLGFRRQYLFFLNIHLESKGSFESSVCEVCCQQQKPKRQCGFLTVDTRGVYAQVCKGLCANFILFSPSRSSLTFLILFL